MSHYIYGPYISHDDGCMDVYDNPNTEVNKIGKNPEIINIGPVNSGIGIQSYSRKGWILFFLMSVYYHMIGNDHIISILSTPTVHMMSLSTLLE